MSSGDFSGRVALVTGAASGIGRATAIQFGRAGASVVVADLDAAQGAETARMIEAEGPAALFCQCDVSREDQVRTLIDRALEAFGRLDHAFNNAGILGPNAPVGDYAVEDWDQVVAINLRGIFLCCKYELPVMIDRGGGTIVNTASVAGLVGRTNFSAYSAAKHGVVGLTKALALEYATAGIRANAVCPGAVKTPMIVERIGGSAEVQREFDDLAAMRRMAEPEELAEAVVWLSSEAASFVTAHMMVVDGGWTAI